MGGSLGQKIGGGATADIHAWAPGQVVKLFKAIASLHCSIAGRRAEASARYRTVLLLMALPFPR